MGQGPGLAIDVLLQLTAGDRAVVFLIIALGLALKALILWWLYEDTTSRGHRPLWWLVAAFFLDLPTLVVWLVVRPPRPDDPATPQGARTPAPPQDEPDPLGDDPYADPPVGPSTEKTQDPFVGPYRPAPEPPVKGERPGADPDEVLLSCPKCGTRFYVEHATGPQRVVCPSCGQSGTLPGRNGDPAPGAR